MGPTCCEKMREAFRRGGMHWLTLGGVRYLVEYTSPTVKDTIRPRAIYYCPWCGEPISWPVAR